MGTDQPLPRRQSLGFLMRVVLRHPLLLAAAFALILLLTALEVANFMVFVPLLATLRGSDGSLAQDTPIAALLPLFEGLTVVERVQLVALLFFAIALLKAAVSYGYGRVAHLIRIQVGRDLRAMVFDDVVGVEQRFINKEKQANLFTLMHSFPSHSTRIVNELLNAVRTSTSFLAVFVTMALTSWQLTLLAVGLAIIVNLSLGKLQVFIRALSHRIRESRLRLHQVSLESLQGMKLIHQFGREEEARTRFMGELTQMQRDQFRRARISALVPALYLIASNALVATVLVGATLLLDRSDGDWLVILGLFSVLLLPLLSRSGDYARLRATLESELPYLEAIVHFMERKDKSYLADGDQAFPGLRQAVRLEGIRFHYEADEPAVLDGIDLTINKGQKVALVGGSGAGKSTIIDLLTRLFDPTEGRVTVDGTDLRRFRIKDWRRRVAVVSQDTFLFHASVADNLRFGNPEATDAQVMEAAKQANAHAFIQELPDGYDTVIGDRGVRLSGGQAQRLAIARAILADPDLLILDEATSALDTATERLVQEAIDRVSRDRTVVAVAHRLSTVRDADMIVVLEKGRIVEQGRHAALLAKGGAYARYVRLQDLGHDATAAEPEPADVDTEADWIHVTLAKPLAGLVAALRAAPGVKAATGRGRALHILLEDPVDNLERLDGWLHEQGATPVAFRQETVQAGAA